MARAALVRTSRSRSARRRPIALAVAVVAASAVLAGCLSVTTTTYGAGNLRTGWYGNQTTLTPGLVSGGTFGQMWNDRGDGPGLRPAGRRQRHGRRRHREPTTSTASTRPAGTQTWHRNVGRPVEPERRALQRPHTQHRHHRHAGRRLVHAAPPTSSNKTYDAGSSGPAAYFAHAVDVATGAERPGFPLSSRAPPPTTRRRRSTRPTHLQRPGLLLMNGVVYAGFGGHCDHAELPGLGHRLHDDGPHLDAVGRRSGRDGQPGRRDLAVRRRPRVRRVRAR